MIARLNFNLGGVKQVSYLIILFEGIFSKITTVPEFSFCFPADLKL